MIAQVLLFAAASGTVSAQSGQPYQPLPFLTESESFSGLVTERYESSKSEVAALDKRVRSHMEGTFGSIQEIYLSYLEEGACMLNGPIYSHVFDILEEVFKANPELRHDKTLLISRFPEFNAFVTNNGVVTVFLGLLTALESDAQLAFILCHEIAHLEMKHADARIRAQAERVADKQFRKEVRTASRQTYGGRIRLMELAREIGFEAARHQRYKESEADSLGLEYFMKTRFYSPDAVRNMEILDSIDFDRSTMLNLEQIFHHDSYPFSKDWLYYAGASSMASVEYNMRFSIDSLKTHPDCLERKEMLERILSSRFPGRSDGLRFIRSEQDFIKLNRMANLEIAESYYRWKNYDLSMYYALQLLEQYPDEKYLHTMVGLNMAQLCAAYQRRELGKVLGYTSMDQPESFNRMLAFLHELRSREMGELAYWYLEKHVPEPIDERSTFAKALAAKVSGRTGEFDSLKKVYLKNYPNGEFIEELN